MGLPAAVGSINIGQTPPTEYTVEFVLECDHLRSTPSKALQDRHDFNAMSVEVRGGSCKPRTVMPWKHLLTQSASVLAKPTSLTYRLEGGATVAFSPAAQTALTVKLFFQSDCPPYEKDLVISEPSTPYNQFTLVDRAFYPYTRLSLIFSRAHPIERFQERSTQVAPETCEVGVQETVMHADAEMQAEMQVGSLQVDAAVQTEEDFPSIQGSLLRAREQALEAQEQRLENSRKKLQRDRAKWEQEMRDQKARIDG